MVSTWWWLCYDWCVLAAQAGAQVYWWHEFMIGDTHYVTPIDMCIYVPRRKVRLINIKEWECDTPRAKS